MTVPLPEFEHRERLILAQPLGTIIWAARKLPNLIDRDVVVIGQGPIGLLWDHLLANMGCATRDRLGPHRLSPRRRQKNAGHAHPQCRPRQRPASGARPDRRRGCRRRDRSGRSPTRNDRHGRAARQEPRHGAAIRRARRRSLPHADLGDLPQEPQGDRLGPSQRPTRLALGAGHDPRRPSRRRAVDHAPLQTLRSRRGVGH